MARNIQIINGDFMYELGPGGTNRWDAQIQAGGREGAPPEETAVMVRKFRASDDMYEALKKCVDALDLRLSDDDLEGPGSPEFQALLEGRAALKKAEEDHG